MRAPGASSFVHWKWGDGTDMNSHLIQDLRTIEKKIEKTGCVALATNEMKWKIIDCKSPVSFACSSKAKDNNKKNLKTFLLLFMVLIV